MGLFPSDFATRMSRATLGLFVAGFTLTLIGCSATPQTKHDRFLASGKKLLEQHDYARAVLQFKNAAQAMPKDPEPYYLTGLALLGTGDLSHAALAFKQALELDPKHIGAQLKLADLMARTDDREMLTEAEKRVREVLDLAPGNVDALNVLAAATYGLGHPDDAETYLYEALTRAPADVRSYANLASVQLAQKHPEETEKTLLQAVSAVPKSAAALVSLGRFYLYSSRLADAEAAFGKAVQIDPHDGAALLDLARAQRANREPDQAEKTFRRLADLPDPRYKPMHAVFLYSTGKTAEAIAEFEALYKKQPENREVRSRLAAAYIDSKRVEQAERLLGDAIKKNPKDADALLQRSQLLLNRGQVSAAQTDLETAAHFIPNDARVHYLLSRVYMAQSADNFRRQELGEALRLDPSMLRARIELADMLIASNAGKSALEVIDAAPSDQQSLLPMLAIRNWALLAQGDLAAARKGISASLERSKALVFTMQEGILKLRERDLSGGRAVLKDVLKSDPNSLLAVQELANSYFKERKDSGGIAVIREALAGAPHSAPLWAYLGQILLLTGDRAGAREAFEQTLKADAAFEPAQLGLAMLDSMDGKIDSARRILHTLTDRPQPNSLAVLRLAMIEDSAQNRPAAIAGYRRAVELRPNDWVPLNNLANSLIESGQYDEALQFAQRAKELAPSVPYVEDTIGWAFYNKGLYASAVKQLELVQNDRAALPRYHLAMAYFKSGNPARGNATLQAAMKMDPHNAIIPAVQQLAREASAPTGQR